MKTADSSGIFRFWCKFWKKDLRVPLKLFKRGVQKLCLHSYFMDIKLPPLNERICSSVVLQSLQLLSLSFACYLLMPFFKYLFFSLSNSFRLFTGMNCLQIPDIANLFSVTYFREAVQVFPNTPHHNTGILIPPDNRHTSS